MIRILTLILLLAIGGYFISKTIFNKAPIRVGEPAPVFSGQLVDGRAFSLEETRGKYVLIDFWGSWCGPCIKDIPRLKALYSKYNNTLFSDAEGFEIVSIALEKSDTFTRQIIEKRGLVWPYHIIDVRQIILLSEYAQLFGVSELPATFLLNPSGEFMGINPSFEEIERILDARIN